MREIRLIPQSLLITHTVPLTSPVKHWMTTCCFRSHYLWGWGGRAENRWQPQSCQLMAVCTINSRRSKNYWGFQLETNIVNTAADHFELHQHLEKPTTESERVDAESTAFLFNSEIRQSCRASVFRRPRPMNTLSQYVPSVGTHGRPRRSKRNFT